jgi:hypothetical protein
VKGDFSLDSGVLNMGAFRLGVKGNTTTDGVLSFSSGEGLVLDGIGSQLLRRTAPGTSGIDILTIDNPDGINQVSGQGHIFQIDQALRMKRGIFNLNGNLLDLGSTATIEQVNAFGQNNMISTGGSFTNFGVRKAVEANTAQDVFMPLGLDKYMPIRLIFSDVGFSSGSSPSSYLFKLNQPSHPVALDPANILQMYYSIDANGVGSNLRMDMELYYDQNYVSVTGSNLEDDYIGARVVDGSPQPTVFKFGTSAVNTTDDIISFSFTNVTAEGISGDYLAGIEEAIPDIVPVFTTTRDGDVNEGQTITGVYDIEVLGGGAPNGAVVRIVDDHVLSLNINGITLYKTIIEDNATLEIDNTTFHRLGIVEGAGTIRLVNTGSLPSGSYNQFFTCSGGRLEYAGNNTYEILSGIPVVRAVRISGTSTRNLANNNVQICEDLEISGPGFINSNLVEVSIGGDLIITSGSYNSNQGFLDLQGNLELSGTGLFTSGNQGQRIIRGNILQSAGTFNAGTGGTNELHGNFVKTGGALASPTGSAKFVFNGNVEQYIRGDFSGASAFRIVEIGNAKGLRLHNNVDVSLRLELSEGNIFTAQDSTLRLANTNATVLPALGSSSSFVSGPLEWVSLNTSANRIFPIGKGDRHRPLTLTNRSATRTWTAEYFDTVATTQPLITSLDPIDPFVIKTVSKQEHWRVNSNSAAATTARIGLSWGENSAVAEDPADYNKLVALHWNQTNEIWESAGSNSTSFNYNALNQNGSFLALNLVSFSERFFTLGSIDAINPLPVTWLYFTGTTDGKGHTLNWATASETNNNFFELERAADGENFMSIARIEGAGNSNTMINYSYVDKLAPEGRVYYRLRQVDFNGKFDYADEVVTLVRTARQTDTLDFLLYPNPSSKGAARLLISDFDAEMVIISITDMQGKILLRKAVYIDEQGISDEIACAFNPGVYIVSVLHTSKMCSKPLVITK